MVSSSLLELTAISASSNMFGVSNRERINDTPYLVAHGKCGINLPQPLCFSHSPCASLAPPDGGSLRSVLRTPYAGRHHSWPPVGDVNASIPSFPSLLVSSPFLPRPPSSRTLIFPYLLFIRVARCLPRRCRHTFSTNPFQTTDQQDSIVH